MRTFRIEIEMINSSRLKVAEAIRSIVGGVIEHDSEDSTVIYIKLPGGRQWKVEDDDSLGVPQNQRAEVVSPPLVESVISLVKRIAEAVARTGATVNEKCGVHVHIGAAGCSVENINQAIDLIIDYESHREQLSIKAERSKFAKMMSPNFIKKFRAKRPQTMKELDELWYGKGFDPRRKSRRYDKSRYRAFNIHSYAIRGTIEFRYFNGTLDSSILEGYIRLCLDIADRANFPE